MKGVSQDDCPVERIGRCTREEFHREYMYRNKPVILTDVVSQWPAASKWNAEYLKSVAGDTEVIVHHNEGANFFEWYVHDAKRVDVAMKLSEFIDRLLSDEDGNDYYMTEYRVSLVSDKLLEDLDFSDYFDSADQPYQPMMFLGRDTCMPLHYHGIMEAFLCQLLGTKRVTLFPPADSRYLYPGAWHEPHPLFSRVDGRLIQAGRVDHQKFPRFEKARAIEITLQPGEMLYIPIHWWHLTAVDGFQINVSHFFKSKLRCWNFPTPGFSVLAREAKKKVERVTSSFRSSRKSTG